MVARNVREGDADSFSVINLETQTIESEHGSREQADAAAKLRDSTDLSIKLAAVKRVVRRYLVSWADTKDGRRVQMPWQELANAMSKLFPEEDWGPWI